LAFLKDSICIPELELKKPATQEHLWTQSKELLFLAKEPGKGKPPGQKTFR
jgi:hypothetical protein